MTVPTERNGYTMEHSYRNDSSELLGSTGPSPRRVTYNSTNHSSWLGSTRFSHSWRQTHVSNRKRKPTHRPLTHLLIQSLNEAVANIKVLGGLGIALQILPFTFPAAHVLLSKVIKGSTLIGVTEDGVSCADLLICQRN